MKKKIRFIADVGSNHNNSLDRAKAIMDQAAAIGCWGVKFQYFRSHLWADPVIAEKMKDWELPDVWLPDLREHCIDLGLLFGCTSFHLNAPRILAPYVDFLKIGSYELCCLDLIKNSVETGLPLIISTGMGTESEIREAVFTAMNAKAQDLTLLHCNSMYPARPIDCNIWKIQHLERVYNLPIGWSDHTVEPIVIYAAHAAGAKMIEFHLDLEDREGWESKVGHCWTPIVIGKVIRNIEIWNDAVSFPSDSAYDRIEEMRKHRTDSETGVRA